MPTESIFYIPITIHLLEYYYPEVFYDDRLVTNLGNKIIKKEPTLNQQEKLRPFLNRKLKGINSNISFGFTIDKKGNTLFPYLIGSERKLNEVEVSFIQNAFMKIKWHPAELNGKPVKIRCSYDIKID